MRNLPFFDAAKPEELNALRKNVKNRFVYRKRMLMKNTKKF